MNKKGFLLGEETVKIIISLIVIVFLVYFLVSLYLNRTGGKDVEFAEESLELLVESISSEISSVEIYNPEGAWIFSWPVEIDGKEIIPNSCLNQGWENCLCICRKKGPYVGLESGSNIDFEKTREECDSNWVCMEAQKEITLLSEGTEYPIKIQDAPLKLKIYYSDEEIIITKE